MLVVDSGNVEPSVFSIDIDDAYFVFLLCEQEKIRGRKQLFMETGSFSVCLYVPHSDISFPFSFASIHRTKIYDQIVANAIVWNLIQSDRIERIELYQNIGQEYFYGSSRLAPFVWVMWWKMSHLIQVNVKRVPSLSLCRMNIVVYSYLLPSNSWQ